MIDIHLQTPKISVNAKLYKFKETMPRHRIFKLLKTKGHILKVTRKMTHYTQENKESKNY